MLLDGITDSGVVMLDNGGIMRSWNEGPRRLHGHPTDSIVGQHVSPLYRADDDDRAATAAARSRLTGGAP